MQIRYLILFLTLSLFSCGKEFEDRETYIQRSLKEKKEKFLEKEEASCLKALYDQAEEIADSLILQEALQLDSLQKDLPLVPPKPVFIEPAPSGDSLAIEPFLDTIQK